MNSIKLLNEDSTTRVASDDLKQKNNFSFSIKSFVRRQGRMTKAQERALIELWQPFAVQIGTIPLDIEQLFGRQAPLILEIGFGDGESLATMCAAEPETNFLGIEVHRPGIGHLLLQAEQLRLKNLRIICLDAVEVVERHLPDECVSRIQIFFPDPWPKLRHHKRRLIQPEFVRPLIRKLQVGGHVHIATDCEDYAQFILKVLSETTDLSNTAPNNRFAQRPSYRPSTKFERRGQRLGQSVWEILFVKSSTENS